MRMDLLLNESRRIYQAKINQVQDYIEDHLDEVLGTTQLAQVASFSAFHFQRIFKLMTGESLYAFIKRLRLEKAAFLLRTNPHMHIQDIALAVGFSAQASLAKAIKDRYGLTASRIRKLDEIGMRRIMRDGNEWKMNANAMRTDELRSHNQSTDELRTNGKVFSPAIQYNMPCELTIKTIEPIGVLYLRHIGAYKGDSDLFMKLFSRLYGHAGRRKLIHAGSSWYAVYHDFGELTEEEKLRVSVCLSVDKAVAGQGEFGRMEIAGGRYVVGRFLLGTDEYQGAWNYMITKWLPESGYMPDDRLCFEHYPMQESRAHGMHGSSGNRSQEFLEHGMQEPREHNMDHERRMVEIFIPIAPL